MTDSENNPIEIAYPPGEFHEPVLLYDGSAELERDGADSVVGEIVVTFVWQPTTNVRFSFVSPRPELEFGDVTIRGIPGSQQLRGHITGTHADGGYRVSGTIIEDVPQVSRISEANFGITNFRPFIGEWIDETFSTVDGNARRSRRAGRLTLSWNDWILVLDERRDSNEVVRNLKDAGGIAITHLASLRKDDESDFSIADANEMLWAIRGYLSLIRGAWAAPVLVAGRDGAGSVVWHDWVPPASARWHPSRGPFDEYNVGEYRRAFPAYLTLWQDELWNETLRRATHMYVDANSGMTLDTAVLMCQTVLELLSWVHFVEDEGIRTRAEFDKERPSTRVRELLEWMQVDPGIPAQLTELSNAALESKWDDGPHAITEIRNAIVHPNRRSGIGDKRLDALVDLYELSLWYVELALLRVIGLEGMYSSRLHSTRVGSVEPLPWSDPLWHPG